MNFKKISCAILAAASLTASTSAFAGVLLEPYLGYSMGKWEQGTSGDDYSGVIYGARVGYTIMGFMFGADYLSGSLPEKSAADMTFKPNDLGVFVGYKFPVMFRAYFTYIPTSKMTAEATGGDTDVEGKGMKVGVGFTGLPIVSINLEYYSSEYDKMNGVAVTPELTAKGYGLTVSAPFDF